MRTYDLDHKTSRKKQFRYITGELGLEYDADPEHDRFGGYGRLLVYLRLEDGSDFGNVTPYRSFVLKHLDSDCFEES